MGNEILYLCKHLCYASTVLLNRIVYNLFDSFSRTEVFFFFSALKWDKNYCKDIQNDRHVYAEKTMVDLNSHEKDSFLFSTQKSPKSRHYFLLITAKPLCIGVS